MKRIKVAVNNLKLGMYVAELDRPWAGTRFMFQGFAISSQEALDELRRTCQFVFVEDGRKGDKAKDVLIPRNNDSFSPRIASTQKANLGLLQNILKEPQISNRCYPDKTTVEEELEQAGEIQLRTQETLYSILDDVRLGRSISTYAAKRMVADMVKSVIRNPDAMMVLSQLKNVDEYTALHSLRVCVLAVTFGRHLEMSPQELNLLGIGALLHDVGKAKVPLEILNKPGDLTDAEFDIIKSHVPKGVELVQQAPGIAAQSLEVVACHHERYGGGGYIAGNSGNAIGPFGLIAGIVDCYDAITSDRVYHKGMTAHEALTKMYEWRTRDFHPGLIEQFIQCMGIYPIGSLVELSDGSVGVITTVNRGRRLKPKFAQVLNPQKIRCKRVKTIDLMQHELENPDTPLWISRILPSGTYEINPIDYLPIKK
jgi:HD-GYP domain-containing protein (c-di-GMP phosphodiesterase class II)